MPDEPTPENSPDTTPTANHGWIKMMRSQDVVEMIEAYPLAFTLATVIAWRTRFQPGRCLKYGYQQGEAFLGDYERCGMSEQQYRTAKKKLEKWGYATFKRTNKGTTAKLTDTRLFDVLNLSANGQANRRITTKQRVDNGQPTTNEERKNGKR